MLIREMDLQNIPIQRTNFLGYVPLYQKKENVPQIVYTDHTDYKGAVDYVTYTSEKNKEGK